MIKDFLKKYGYYYVTTWFWHIVALLCMVTMDPMLLVAALLLFLIVAPLMQLISHDYISHEFIKPKNRFYEIIALTLWYALGQTIHGKKSFHTWHHKSWQLPDVDPTQQLLQGKNLFRYVFSLHSPKPQHIPDQDHTRLFDNAVIKWLDQHAMIIYWGIVAVLLIVLSWPMFVVVRIYVPWFMALTSKFHDWYFHGGGPKKDSAWLIPVYSHSAWHIEHHSKWQNEYYGPSFWKWLTPSWYIRKIMFNSA